MKNNIKIDKSLEKILIIGANGFLGKNIISIRNQKNFYRKYSFVAADIRNTNIPSKIPYYDIDITNKNECLSKIIKISPGIIILTAAMTNVDKCEANKKLASKINTQGPKNVLTAAKKTGSKLVFMSTDFVFDGKKLDGLYTELDNPNPLSHYAKTKLEAEKLILESNIKYLICRTAVLYGWNRDKQNFITWVLNTLKHGREISIVTNQINTPTFVVNLAEILLKMIEKNANGIYHTAGSTVLNRYEIALKCAEVFELNKNLIKPVEKFKQKAKRPQNAGLNITKLRKLIKSELNIFSLEEGLNFMKSHKIE